MKCENGGGEVSLEQKFCPFCGKENTQATEHQRDMDAFKRRYEQTEASVKHKTRKYAMVTIRVVGIVVLLIACIIMFAVAESAYSMPGDARRRASQRNPEPYKAALEKYLEEGDYRTFCSYGDYHNLRWFSDSPFREYRDIYMVCQDYDAVMRMAENLILHGDEEKWRTYSMESDITHFVNYLDSFEERIDRNYSEEASRFDVYVSDMQENVNLVLETCFGMSAEEREEFMSLSAGKKSVVIEDALIGEK